MKMRKIIALLMTVILWKALYSQDAGNGMIQVRVVDDQKKPLPGTTVELLRKDSLLIKAQITDTSGKAIFLNIQAGEYFYKISKVGFASYISSFIILSSNEEKIVPEIILKTLNDVLSGVTVTARKPFLELLPNK